MYKRFLGIIGSLLYVFSFLPHIGFYFLIIGFISLFFAIKDISQKAVKNLFIAFLINIFTYIIYIIWGIGTIGALFAYISNPNSYIALGSLVIGILGVLGSMYILGIISSIFYKNALIELKNHTNIKYFEWAGYLILFGYLSMIFVVGIFIAIVGWLLVIYGFIMFQERKALPKPFPKESH